MEICVPGNFPLFPLPLQALESLADRAHFRPDLRAKGAFFGRFSACPLDGRELSGIIDRTSSVASSYPLGLDSYPPPPHFWRYDDVVLTAVSGYALMAVLFRLLDQ